MIKTSRDMTVSLIRRDNQITKNIPTIDQENATLKAIVPKETN
jgi:hypothetical protein